MKTFIVVHLIISTIFIVFFYINSKHMISTIASSIIVLSFPIGGAVIVYILNLVSLEFLSKRSRDDYLGYFDNERQQYRFVKTLNVVEETRVIPMQKALIEEDIIRRREAVLSLIKKDVNKYSSLMNMALMNDDSETSHYAASSILHSKRKLDNDINRLSELYNNSIDNPKVLVEYADKLVEFINNGYVDYSTKVKYIQESIDILEKIVNEKLDLDNRHIYNLINILLEAENFETATKYTQILMENYPNSEEKFLVALKAFYVMKNRDKFDTALKEFISSEIVFSKETVNIVRFWLGG